MEASTPVWEGVEHGWGHLRGAGSPSLRPAGASPAPPAELWLPGPDGTVATAASPVVAVTTPAPAPTPATARTIVAAVAIGAAAG